MRSTSLHGEEEHREHRVSLQRHRLPRECVAYIQPCRYDAWLWLPPQDPAAKPPPNRRPLWLPLHCAAARQEASLRFVPRQPKPQKKKQHRSEERRGGKEGRSRWLPDPLKKKIQLSAFVMT